MPIKKNSRAKKKAIRERIEDPEIEITPEEAQAPASGRTITVRKTILSEPLTPADIEAIDSSEPPEGDELAAFDESTNFSDGISSDLLTFFDEDGGDGGHKLRVIQIMQPGRGVKFTKGGTIYRGEIPYTASFLNDVQEQYGGGVFRLQVVGTWHDPETGRQRFGIIKARTVTIAAPPKLIMPEDPSQPAHAPYPGGLNVPYLLNPPADTAPPATMKENLTELVAVVRMVDQLRGGNQQAPAQAPLDPEVAALTLIAKNPEIMDKLGAGIAKTVLGAHAGNDGDDWPGVIKALITSGQGPELLRVGLQTIISGFKELFTPAPVNGHAPQQPMPTPEQLPPAQAPGQIQPTQPPMPGQQIAPPPDPGPQAMQPNPNDLPEDQALALLIQFCARGVPPGTACERLLGYADMINTQAPQYSIDQYIDDFVEMPVDAVLEFVKTQRGGEVVATLPHARAWVEQLQAKLKEQNEGDMPQ